ncbi:MAG: xanthine dehydrogenase family protein molybdopterin-binding subunit [Pyrinomonadaceae bacterium]
MNKELTNPGRNKAIGEAVNRIDGILKVTGAATYATDWPIKNLAYAIIAKTATAAGTISELDTAEAEKAPGVIAVISHKNAPKVTAPQNINPGSVFQGTKIDFYGQHMAVVVAETFEQARAAAGLIKATYAKTDARANFEELAKSAQKGTRPDAVRGDFEKEFAAAEHKIDFTYETPIEHHHPMEPHSSIAMWEGEKLVIYNPSQVVNGMQNTLASAFGIKPEMVRVITPHIGGGFGSKGGAWGNSILAAMAAKVVNRPVKLALTRQQMVNSVGLRQKNVQRMRLAATAEGKLTAIAHETTTHTATTSQYIEGCGDISSISYEVANSLISYKFTPMNVISPTFVRGPGKAPGSFALESAIDELAYKLKIDPVEFRIKNEPTKDPGNGRPFSSRATVECLKRGAEMIGWKNRKIEPRQNRNGDFLVGYGVGIGNYPARQTPTSAIVKLTRKGNDIDATIELAASDLGTGTHTILAQIASETLDLPISKVAIKIGDSLLPPAAGSVGSIGAASFSNAVSEACLQARTELQAKSTRQYVQAPSIAELLDAASLNEYQTRVDAKPPADAGKFSSHSFNANFAEVWVNELTGMVRVKRMAAVTGAGRILNPKTTRSQIIGGCIWGIGMALTEESVLDPRWGNFVTRTFADYHIPVNLDIGTIDVAFIAEEDKVVNKLGVKGVGEVGIVGVAAAVANAVFNATGKRVRSLPITPDKLL